MISHLDCGYPSVTHDWQNKEHSTRQICQETNCVSSMGDASVVNFIALHGMIERYVQPLGVVETFVCLSRSQAQNPLCDLQQVIMPDQVTDELAFVQKPSKKDVYSTFLFPIAALFVPCLCRIKVRTAFRQLTSCITREFSKGDIRGMLLLSLSPRFEVLSVLQIHCKMLMDSISFLVFH